MNELFLRKWTNILICGFIIVVVLIYAQNILIPFIIAVFFSVFIRPLEKFVYKWLPVRWLSILMSFFIVSCFVVGVIFLFSLQLNTIIKSLPDIEKELENGAGKIIQYLSELLNVSFQKSQSIFNDLLKFLTQNSANSIGTGLSFTSSFVSTILFSILFSFFISLYKNGFKKVFLYFASKAESKNPLGIISKLVDMVQSYFLGLFLVIGILFILNSIALSIIGIKFAIFWAALAAVLALLPYIGTLLGGLLPFVYSISTSDNFIQPVSVVIVFIVIQQLEGNLITPKIIGDKVGVNPLVSIIAILLMGMLWGIFGVILAIPILAIGKILLESSEKTIPISLLLSSKIANEKYIDKRLNELSN